MAEELDRRRGELPAGPCGGHQQLSAQRIGSEVEAERRRRGARLTRGAEHEVQRRSSGRTEHPRHRRLDETYPRPAFERASVSLRDRLDVARSVGKRLAHDDVRERRPALADWTGQHAHHASQGDLASEHIID
jgi:hypothetical protein